MVWALTLLLNLTILLAFWAALGDASLIPVTSMLLALTLFFFFFTTLTIEVDEKSLRVGRARILREFIGDIEILDQASMRLARGRDLDPAAYLALRFWIKTGVRIQIIDQEDPTPYWLVSTNESERLVKALHGKIES